MRHLPSTEGSKLGQHERFRRTAVAEIFRHDLGAAVRVDAMNVDRRALLVQVLDPRPVNERGYRHCRVVGIELFDHCGNVVDCLPDDRVVAVSEALHFIANAPEQKRRMVFVAQHRLASTFKLLRHLGLVVVVETVTFVPQPDADGHRQAEGVGRVETLADVVRSPGTQ